jgi:hypothetical protein
MLTSGCRRLDGDLHLLRGVCARFRLLAFDAFFTATPFFSSHARNARATWTERGTHRDLSLAAARPEISGSIRNAVSSTFAGAVTCQAYDDPRVLETRAARTLD